MKPEVVGSAPVATWTYRARNWTAPAKTMPQMMVPSSEMVKVGSLKRRSGTVGSPAVDSALMNRPRNSRTRTTPVMVACKVVVFAAGLRGRPTGPGRPVGRPLSGVS
ncbi:hypothetical protein [Streptomyces sp. NBC_01185]|uniref:hypothetical protein n=1 Tax=Streptomyces sp. NBC_01185 TaxID=2903764 RepID=UPI00386ECE7F|nr:hypothetical protein OG770_36335 [Streptomyces sp. NBC_01185]